MRVLSALLGNRLSNRSDLTLMDKWKLMIRCNPVSPAAKSFRSLHSVCTDLLSTLPSNDATGPLADPERGSALATCSSIPSSPSPTLTHSMPSSHSLISERRKRRTCVTWSKEENEERMSRDWKKKTKSRCHVIVNFPISKALLRSRSYRGPQLI